jgi:hypothetical protein
MILLSKISLTDQGAFAMVDIILILSLLCCFWGAGLYTRGCEHL